MTVAFYKTQLCAQHCAKCLYVDNFSVTCILQRRKLRFTEIEYLSQVYISHKLYAWGQNPNPIDFGDLGLEHHGMMPLIENVTNKQPDWIHKTVESCFVLLSCKIEPGSHLLDEELQWLFISNHTSNFPTSCLPFKYKVFLWSQSCR